MAWCRDEKREVPLEEAKTEEEEGRKGPLLHALCPSCGARVARKNRWGYWEPRYAPRVDAPSTASEDPQD